MSDQREEFETFVRDCHPDPWQLSFSREASGEYFYPDIQKLWERWIARGWMDIETAPKDGTAIWVIDAAAREPRAGPAHWHGEWRAGGPEDWLLDDAAEKWGTYPSPTHWMPLPPPPHPSRVRAFGEGEQA